MAHAGFITKAPSYLGLTQGLVGSWSFNGPDMSGNTATDRSGQGNNGTLTNGPKRGIGKIGQALEFDGVNDYVDAGDPASLDVTGSLTISTWVKADAFPNGDDNYILTKTTSPTGNIAYKLTATIDNAVEQFYFLVSSNGSTVAQRYTATTIAANTRYHVVGVFDATAQTLSIYLNGSLNNGTLDGTVPSSIVDSSGTVKVGTLTGASNRSFDGLIDEVRVYNRALTADEIKRLYNMGR